MSKNVLVFSVLAFASNVSYADICSNAVTCDAWPTKAIAKDSLEEALNDTFYQFANNCNMLSSIKKDGYRIPKVIANNSALMGFSKKIIRLDGDSAPRLFGFMFSANDINGITTGKKLDTNNYIGQVLDSNVPEPRASSSMLGYKQTCTSYLQASIAGGLKVPTASVESALSGEDKSTSNLIIVRGIFESPLYRGISDNSIEDNMKFWMAYTAKKSYSPDWRYLKAFEGVSVYKAQSEDRTAEFSVKAGASLGPIGISSAAGFSQKTEFDSKEFQQFVIQPTDISDMFAQAPLPSVIVDLFNSTFNAPAADKTFGGNNLSTELVIFDVDDFEYWYEVSGLNKKICNSAFWEGVNKKNVSYGMAFNDATNKCRFVVHGTTQGLDFSQPTIDIDAVFQSKQALKDSSKDGERRLSFVAKTTARVSLHPQFIPPNQPADSQSLYNSGGAVIQTQWSIPFAFQDDDRSWDRTKRASIKFLPGTNVTCATSGRSFAVTISSPQADSFGIVAKTIPSSSTKDEVCQLETEVTLPLASGKALKRPVKVALKLP